MENQSPVLSASHIKKNFGRQTVLADISFEAAASDIVGIVGINGDGKSTLLSILAGVRKAQGGSFQVHGRDLFKERSAFRSLVGYLPQENPLLGELSVQDNLRLWYGTRISPDLPILTKLQLTEMLGKKVRELSGGMKRRLAIACSVAENQPVLILDEPTAALDLHQKQIITDYLLEYASGGNIVLFSTHDESEIRLCTRLYYIRSGMAVPVDAESAIAWLKEGIR